MARSARRFPTAEDFSVFVPLASSAVLVTVMSVRPWLSSTSWAVMCFSERKTTRRGRSAVPVTVFRRRRWRRWRFSWRVFGMAIFGITYLPPCPPFGGRSHPDT